MAYVGQMGYANATAPITRPADGSYDLVLERDGFRFHDSWYGGEPFGGMEVVSKDGKPFWMMTYFGSLIEPDESAADVYGICLKEALRIPAPEFPVRGAKIHVASNSYTYSIDWQGDINRFKGEEKICNKDAVIVYVGQISGGLVDQ